VRNYRPTTRRIMSVILNMLIIPTMPLGKGVTDMDMEDMLGGELVLWNPEIK